MDWMTYMVKASLLSKRPGAAELTAVVCGLTLHVLFNKFEKRFIVLLKRLLFLAPLLPAYTFWSRHPKSLLRAICQAYAISYGTLITSVIVYRLSPFHPLSRFPGPLLAKCSKFWGIYHSATGKMHRNFLNLHRKYGPIVRIGPNELSFCEADSIQPVLGVRGMGKGPIWDGRKSPKSKHFALIGIRDTAFHLQRRKPWNKALNIANVRKYEPILKNRLNQLLDIIHSKAKEKAVFDMAELMSFFSYDFMGDMAFGGGFELMKEGDKEGLWKLMEAGVRVQAYTQHIPWASPILYSLPGMGKAAQKLISFVVNLSKSRIKRGMTRTGEDLSSYLLDEGSPHPNPLPFGDYSSDAFLAIVAGSDTAATALSCILYHILVDKSHFTRLRNEIDEHFSFTGDQRPADEPATLGNMPYLNAVINEALRLDPPVPTGLQRTPDSGTGHIKVTSNIIPEGTGIFVPPYAIHRDPRYFSPEPDRFWPDRWTTTDKSVITNQEAFIPYSVGPMNCAGKLLAQFELRAVVATLVQKFDMDLAPDWNPENWENCLEDYFIFKKGNLPIIVKERVRVV